MVLSIGRAEIIGQARGEFALEASCERSIGHRRAEFRGKAAGKKLAEAEPLSAGRVGERNRGGNEAGVGIAIEEGRRAAAPAVVAEGVEFHLVRQIDACVDEDTRRLALGISPALRRDRDVCNARVDERLRVGTLDAARRRAGVHIFAADVDETGIGEGEPDIALDEEVLAIALVELAVASDQQAALAVAAQAEIEDARDRIRSIERGRPVAQNLELADRDRRDRREVGTLRSANIGNIGELDRRAAMTPLAVHEHQRLVRRQAAERERPGEDGAVIADEALDVERRNFGAKQVVHIGRALFEQFGASDDVDRLGGIGRLEVVPPRARHDNFALRRSRPRCLFGVILREGGGGRHACQDGDNRATRAKQFPHGPLPFAKALGFPTELSSRPWHDQK